MAASPGNTTRARDSGARFEQWARNPRCRANTLAAVAGIPMSEVARRDGLTPASGQSPFAIARAVTFERALLRDGAAILRGALEQAGVIPAGSRGFRDFRLRANGGSLASFEESSVATAGYLTELAHARTAVQRAALFGLAARPAIRLPGPPVLPEAFLSIDVLAVTTATERPVLTVGAVRSYPDRGGYTNPESLALARALAGIYVSGLRLVLEELGLERAVEVSDQGFLVLPRPGFSSPSIRAGESLRYQVARARRGFEELGRTAAELARETDPERLIEAVRRAEIHYDESCLSFCERAAFCHQRALAAGDGACLGVDVARFLGETRLPRAIELLEGARPQTSAEADLVRRFQVYDLPPSAR